MSTRRWPSFGVTCTPFSDCLAYKFSPSPKSSTSEPRMSPDLLARIRLPPDQHLLCFVVECNLFAGLDGCNVHAKGDRMAVTCIDAGVRRLTRTDTLHPVAHIG